MSLSLKCLSFSHLIMFSPFLDKAVALYSIGLGRPGGFGITKLHAKREKIRYVELGSLNNPSTSTVPEDLPLDFSLFLSSCRYVS